MNVKAILISILTVLLLGAAAVVVFFASGEDAPSIDLSKLDEMTTEAVEARVGPLLAQDGLKDAQVVKVLHWLFANQPGLGESLLREHAFSVSGMPEHVGEAGWRLIRDDKGEASLQLLSIGRELFPNNPHILSMLGIVNVLGDRPIQARQFLEEAYRWDDSNALTNYYLGGLLIRSTSISDRARGKSAMWKVLKGEDARLSELAGLLLLTNDEIPFIEPEYREVLDVLEEHNAFRTENENLSAEALRFILNRLVRVLPAEALELGQLLVAYPDSTIEDRLGVVELAQNQGQTDIAGDMLERIDPVNIPEDSDLALRYERARAIHAVSEGQFDTGVALILEQIGREKNPDLLRQAIERALQFDISIDAEVSLLRGFLELPVENPIISLRVLRRLTEISPLRESEYHAYAVENLLPKAPVIVSQWLAFRGKADLAIAALQELESNSSEINLALVESYLAEEKTEAAQAVLDEAWNAFSPARANYLQARLHHQAGESGKAIEHWIAARDAAAVGSDFELLKNLGFLALELEQHMNALQSTYTAFSSGIPFTEQQVLSLMGLAIEYGTLNQTMELCKHLASEHPEHAVYQNNLAYFQFLAEEDVDKAVEVMRELVEDYPDINQYKLTLAFGLLKAGRTNEASRLIQSTSIDWEEAGIRGQMIYAAVLAASDQRLAAEGLIQNMDTSTLLPEEKALLESF